MYMGLSILGPLGENGRVKMDTHFLPALNPHDKKILKAHAMNGPHVTGLINATVLGQRSQPIL